MPAKKSTTKKAVVKTAPIAEPKCPCGDKCQCHCHGSSHLIKHIIVWAIIFALGLVCGKMMSCNHRAHKPMQRTQPVFVNGCLDIQSITNKKLAEKLATADVNGDECISVDEYQAVRKEMNPAPKTPRGPKSAK